MDPNKQGGDADRARLPDAVRLRGPSSFPQHQPQQHPPLSTMLASLQLSQPPSLLQPQPPPQGLAPTAVPRVRPELRQQLDVARQPWSVPQHIPSAGATIHGSIHNSHYGAGTQRVPPPIAPPRRSLCLDPIGPPRRSLGLGPIAPPQPNQPQFQPQGQGHDVGESSTRAGYVGSPRNINIWDMHAPGTPFSDLVMPRPSVPTTLASTLSARAAEFFPTVPVARPSSTPSMIASQHQASTSRHQARAAPPGFPTRRDNGSLDRHASALPSAGDHVGLQGSSRGVHRQLTRLEEVRALLLRGPLLPGHRDFASSSTHVVRLLKDGFEDVRPSVVNGVIDALHDVMGSSEWCVVFEELLRERRVGELCAIVAAACQRDGSVSLARLVENECGQQSLKLLFKALEQWPNLRPQLIDVLLSQGLMEQRNSKELLLHFFHTLPNPDCSMFIRFAMANIGRILSTSFGLECMLVCLDAAPDGELEETIVSHTSELAMGKWSNKLLLLLLKIGNGDLRGSITERVADDIARLSENQYGTLVVRACFLPTGLESFGRSELPMLRRVLTALLALPDGQLAELVQHPRGSHVVHTLLVTCKNTMEMAWRVKNIPAAGALPKLFHAVRMQVHAIGRETVDLARRINVLAAGAQEQSDAWRVMLVVQEVLALHK